MSTWIPISERLPTREDADETGEVVWKWKDGTLLTAPFDGRDNSDDAPVAWHPLPPYAPPKPGPTDEECDRLCGEVRTAPGYCSARHLVCDWFANVMARIERERQA